MTKFHTFEVTVYKDDYNEDFPFTVTGVLPPWHDHDTVAKSLKHLFSGCEFDCEQGQFFAYAPTEFEALRLAQAVVEEGQKPLVVTTDVATGKVVMG
jgi:hypothetical protein